MGRKMNMAELQTPAAQTPATPAPAPAPQPPQKKKKKRNIKKIVTRVIGGAVAVAVIGGVAFGMNKFLFTEPEQTILDDMVQRGSIQSMVEGYGYVNAQNSASIVLGTGGTVQEVFVQNGDFVNEGDPLYTIDASAAYESINEAQKVLNDALDGVTAAQKTVSDYQEQIQKIRDSYSELEVRAPFAGKLLDVENITENSTVSAGTKIATLVDDSQMRLSVYVNYAYQYDIAEGQTARVSIPSAMSDVDALVEKINMVRYITPEGSQCFEVVLLLRNPGSLTAGMGASAVFTSAAGEPIYPYSAGTLEYSRTSDIVTKATGDALMIDLINYIDVAEGQLLLQLSDDTKADQISDLEDQVRSAQESVTRAQESVTKAQENLTKAEEGLENYNAVAPISGTVLSCPLVPGEKVADNTTAIVIADTSVMTVQLNVDERQISSVELGMEVTLSDWDGNTYFGTVTDKALTGTQENGAVTYPVTVQVDNSDGSLMNQGSLNYSFVASQVDDCIMVPIQSVKRISGADGEPVSVVFVKTDVRPDNAIELPPDTPGVPTEEEGYYAVPVETGISDTYNVEIKSDLEEGLTIFTSYTTTDQTGGYGGGLMIG